MRNARRRATVGLLLGLLTLLALPVLAAQPAITFQSAPSDAPEDEAREWTPAEGGSVNGVWAIRAVITPGEPSTPSDVPAFVASAAVRVVVVEGERGTSYNDGEPIFEEHYECPEPGTEPHAVTPTAEIATTWDTTARGNGVYAIEVTALSCDPNDKEGRAV